MNKISTGQNLVTHQQFIAQFFSEIVAQKLSIQLEQNKWKRFRSEHSLQQQKRQQNERQRSEAAHNSTFRNLSLPYQLLLKQRKRRLQRNLQCARKIKKVKSNKYKFIMKINFSSQNSQKIYKNKWLSWPRKGHALLNNQKRWENHEKCLPLIPPLETALILFGIFLFGILKVGEFPTLLKDQIWNVAPRHLASRAAQTKRRSWRALEHHQVPIVAHRLELLAQQVHFSFFQSLQFLWTWL